MRISELDKEEGGGLSKAKMVGEGLERKEIMQNQTTQFLDWNEN